MVEDSGVPVGYALGFPDLNVLLARMRGRLFPLGFVTLLTGLRRVRDYRLFGLAVLPAYHNLGLDVLLYMSLYEALAPRGVRLEANYILEDNRHIRNALEKLELEQTKIYRVYEKALA
jgi:GNAT superfamily N-acetyltransferase